MPSDLQHLVERARRVASGMPVMERDLSLLEKALSEGNHFLTEVMAKQIIEGADNIRNRN